MHFILSLLKDLCIIPSVSHDIESLGKVVTMIKKIFEDIPGVIIHEYTFNGKPSLIVANFEGKNADIILNGHVDVVSATQENQFAGYIDGKKFFARGSGDMKAGVVVMIEVMKELLLEKYIDKKVACIFTSDEEIGGFDGVKRIIEEGYNAPLVIIPDSGSLSEIVYAEKGVINIDIIAHGVSGHSSRPWLCENPIYKIIGFYNELRSFLESFETHDPYWKNTVEITKFSSGTASNVIPDLATATYNIRYIETVSFDQIKQTIDILSTRYTLDCSITLHGTLLYSEPNHNYIRSYLKIASKYVDDMPILCKEHGASDARYFADQGSIVILHRPTCGNIHGSNEWVNYDEILLFKNLYIDFILSLEM